MARVIHPVLLVAVLSAACDSGSPEQPASATRDSAGVRIVESSAPSWGPDDGWRVDTIPTLTIGVPEGAAEYELFRVRGAIRLRDSTIVIANSGTAELRFYDATGTYLHTVGGRGEGPGEFESVQVLRAWPGDSVATVDFRLRRVQLFSATGAFVRSVLLEPGQVAFPRGLLDDGSVLMAPGVPLGFRGSGVSRITLPFFVHRPDGSIGDTLGEFLAGEFYQHGTGSPPNIIQLPFGKVTWTATNGHVFLGTSDAFEVRAYTATGTLEMIFRILEPPRAVTDSDRDRLRAVTEVQARENEFLRNAVEAFDAAPMPATVPAFDRLLVDRAGYLWMRLWNPNDDDPSTWRVFDQSGAWLGEVVIPARAYPLEIGADYVLARVSDELDIERVVQYRLER